MVFLDNASTTKVLDVVAKEMQTYFCDTFYNPGALYSPAFFVHKKVEECRGALCKFLGASEGTVIFTGSATEANNMVLRCVKKRKQGKIVVSCGEHASIYETAKQLELQGENVVWVPLQENGCVNMQALESVLDENVDIVSMIHVSNETGAINPLREISALVRKKAPNALLHSDGVQAFGKIDVDIDELDVDFYTMSAHKIHGPKGIGALYVKNIKNIKHPLIFGGGQEMGLRSGTTNVPLIMGFVKATEEKFTHKQEYFQKVKALKQAMAESLAQICNVCFNGNIEKDSPYILSVSLLHVRGEVLLHALEAEQVYVGTGSACSSKTIENRVLRNMGKNQVEIEGNIRISFNGYDEVDVPYVVEKIAKLQKKLAKTR